MKLFKTLIFLLLVGVINVIQGQGKPCGSDAFLEECAPGLGDYTFVKTFDVKPKMGEKEEVSYIMSKGAKYKIVICDQKIKGYEMKVKLYDRNKKLIFSNYMNSKYYPSITYTCSATGVYYIEASFKSTKEGCGVLILGFTN